MIGNFRKSNIFPTQISGGNSQCKSPLGTYLYRGNTTSVSVVHQGPPTLCTTTTRSDQHLVANMYIEAVPIENQQQLVTIQCCWKCSFAKFSSCKGSTKHEQPLFLFFFYLSLSPPSLPHQTENQQNGASHQPRGCEADVLGEDNSFDKCFQKSQRESIKKTTITPKSW